MLICLFVFFVRCLELLFNFEIEKAQSVFANELNPLIEGTIKLFKESKQQQKKKSSIRLHSSKQYNQHKQISHHKRRNRQKLGRIGDKKYSFNDNKYHRFTGLRKDNEAIMTSYYQSSFDNDANDMKEFKINKKSKIKLNRGKRFIQNDAHFWDSTMKHTRDLYFARRLKLAQNRRQKEISENKNANNNRNERISNQSRKIRNETQREINQFIDRTLNSDFLYLDVDSNFELDFKTNNNNNNNNSNNSDLVMKSMIAVENVDVLDEIYSFSRWSTVSNLLFCERYEITQALVNEMDWKDVNLSRKRLFEVLLGYFTFSSQMAPSYVLNGNYSSYNTIDSNNNNAVISDTYSMIPSDSLLKMIDKV